MEATGSLDPFPWPFLSKSRNSHLVPFSPHCSDPFPASSPYTHPQKAEFTASVLGEGPCLTDPSLWADSLPTCHPSRPAVHCASFFPVSPGSSHFTPGARTHSAQHLSFPAGHLIRHPGLTLHSTGCLLLLASHLLFLPCWPHFSLFCLLFGFPPSTSLLCPP